MKTKDLSNFMRVTDRLPRRSRGRSDGPNVRTALLGVLCAAGVLGVLTLLFHFG